MCAEWASFLSPPVSLLDLLSYVTGFSLSARYEAETGGYSLGYGHPTLHPFHWPTVGFPRYSQIGNIPVIPWF